MPRGNAPAGAFYPAETVSAIFFSKEAGLARKNLIRSRLPFLHGLIYSKIEKATRERKEKRLRRRTTTQDATSTVYEEDVLGGTEDVDIDLLHLEEIEGISHSTGIEPDKLDDQRLEHVGGILRSLK